jgi:hypothetical protein
MALLMSVAGSAPAAAAECGGTVEHGAFALCVEGSEQLGETAFTTQKKAATPNRFDIVSWVEPTCSGESGKGHFKATVSALELSGFVMTYSGCTVPAPAHCAIKPLILDGGGGTGTGPGVAGLLHSSSEILLGAAERTFTTLHIFSEGGTCGVSGNPVIVGAEKCLLPESTVEAVEHTVECKPTGSTLEWREVGPAEMLLTQQLKLASGKKWSLYKA